MVVVVAKMGAAGGWAWPLSVRAWAGQAEAAGPGGALALGRLAVVLGRGGVDGRTKVALGLVGTEYRAGARAWAGEAEKMT